MTKYCYFHQPRVRKLSIKVMSCLWKPGWIVFTETDKLRLLIYYPPVTNGSIPDSKYLSLKQVIGTFYFMCINVCPLICMYTMYVPSTCRGQKRSLTPLNLEWQMIMSPVDAGTWTKVLYKSSTCSWQLGHLSSHYK